MTAPTFTKALTLWAGTILTPGRRTITAALTVLGLQTGQTLGKYHRVLNRAAWSPMVASRLLWGMRVTTLVPADQPLVVVMDETRERRRGQRILYQGGV
ncbi:MAG: transposase [Armatimonadetes bacterium]|nr:transposase [Armatimonadota bacterium]